MCEIRIKHQMHFEYQEIKKYYRNDEMAIVRGQHYIFMCTLYLRVHYGSESELD